MPSIQDRFRSLWYGRYGRRARIAATLNLTAEQVTALIADPNADVPDPGSSGSVGSSSAPVEDFQQGTDAGFGFGSSWEAFSPDEPAEHPPTTYPPNTHFKYQGSKIWVRPGATGPLAALSAVYNSPIYTISDAEAAEFGEHYSGLFYPNAIAFASLYAADYSPRDAFTGAFVYVGLFGDGGSNGIWFGGWTGPFIGGGMEVVVPNVGDKVYISNSFVIDIAYPDATE